MLSIVPCTVTGPLLSLHQTGLPLQTFAHLFFMMEGQDSLIPFEAIQQIRHILFQALAGLLSVTWDHRAFPQVGH